MPTIGATFQRARVEHLCSTCHKPIPERSRYIRAYGYAEVGDRPYAIKVHAECVDEATREKARFRHKRKDGAS